jgi:O-methyltransferase involved in polyketide biosynthesis
MKRWRAGSTSFIPTVVRVIESYSPGEIRLLYDPHARFLLGPLAGMVLRFGIIRKIFVNLFEGGTPGIIGGFLSRTRYIDDILERAVHDDTSGDRQREPPLKQGARSRPF